ncbi:hypothetical protein N7463_008017 [Penicillium fimorum]|uniref:Uncharacterized protein n=1 Tax=Penicillium fimorum TaxID=1882269 RepID=A0A9X0C7K4_9EURO|nr:hypothetical protein N7463_008017 [Penicillium fimorum]
MKYGDQKKKKQKETSPGRLELPTSRLTVGRANQLRHGDVLVEETRPIILVDQVSVAQLVSASDC